MFQKNRGTAVPSINYPTAKAELELDLVSFVKARALGKLNSQEKD